MIGAGWLKWILLNGNASDYGTIIDIITGRKKLQSSKPSCVLQQKQRFLSKITTPHPFFRPERPEVMSNRSKGDSPRWLKRYTLSPHPQIPFMPMK